MVMWSVMLVLWMVIRVRLEALELFQVLVKLSSFVYLCIELQHRLRFWTMKCRLGVRNSIKIAALLVKEQMNGSTLLGRIPPM